MNSRLKANKIKFVVIPIIIFIVVIILLLSMIIMREKSMKYVFSERLDKQVITIDDKKITLYDTCYYIIDVENTINEMAVAYNPNDPTEFWNTHFSNSMNSVFTRDYARKLVRELCIYDYIMEQEAYKKDVSLNDNEIAEAKEQASDFYEGLSEKAKKNTTITREAVEDVCLRKKLVTKYVELVAKNLKKEGYTDDMISQLNYDGTLYQNTIKKEYNIDYSEYEFNNLPMGSISIN